jgi:hypothetical protein
MQYFKVEYWAVLYYLQVSQQLNSTNIFIKICTVITMLSDSVTI